MKGSVMKRTLIALGVPALLISGLVACSGPKPKTDAPPCVLSATVLHQTKPGHDPRRHEQITLVPLQRVTVKPTHDQGLKVASTTYTVTSLPDNTQLKLAGLTVAGDKAFDAYLPPGTLRIGANINTADHQTFSCESKTVQFPNN